MFKHSVAGRALLVSHSELFEPLTLGNKAQFQFQFRARGLPYLSHRYDFLLSSWREHSVFLQEVLQEKQKAIEKPIQQLQETAAPEFRDHLLLATLAVFQKSPVLLELVNRTEPVDIAQLRQTVRDYSGVDFSALQSLLVDAMPTLLQRSKTRKAVNRLTMHLDSLFHVGHPDGARREMVWRTATRFIELLQARRVSETQWRSIVTNLAHAELLEASSSIYLWCPKCPEVEFTVPTILTKCDLPPFCPCCGRDAHAIAALVPAGALQDAIFAPDGLLGVAVAWHLRKRGFRFEAAKHTGTTELDFLVKTRSGPILLECKMLHSLSWNLTANLWNSRNQLRNHIKALITQGMKPYRAACIVNIPRKELRPLLQSISPESDMEFNEAAGTIISYQRFPSWLESQRTLDF